MEGQLGALFIHLSTNSSALSKRHRARLGAGHWGSRDEFPVSLEVKVGRTKLVGSPRDE